MTLNNFIFVVLQSATEFLPVSSSGHLALLSNIIAEPDIFFFAVLHLASMFAVILFTRKEILKLISFDKRYIRMWGFLAIATLPAAIVGLLFSSFIEGAFSSTLFIGIAFIFTGVVLLITKFSNNLSNSMNSRSAVAIGLSQVLALFPGVSRSGITISSALFFGINREEAIKFSFLLFIPLSAGAFILESIKGFYINSSIVLSFLLCFVLSLVFLKLLFIITKKGGLWIFSIYCFLIGVFSLVLYNS